MEKDLKSFGRILFQMTLCILFVCSLSILSISISALYISPSLNGGEFPATKNRYFPWCSHPRMSKYQPINQNINLSIKLSINQSIKISIDQTKYQSMNQNINQSIKIVAVAVAAVAAAAVAVDAAVAILLKPLSFWIRSATADNKNNEDLLFVPSILAIFEISKTVLPILQMFKIFTMLQMLLLF